MVRARSDYKLDEGTTGRFCERATADLEEARPVQRLGLKFPQCEIHRTLIIIWHKGKLNYTCQRTIVMSHMFLCLTILAGELQDQQRSNCASESWNKTIKGRICIL